MSNVLSNGKELAEALTRDFGENVALRIAEKYSVRDYSPEAYQEAARILRDKIERESALIAALKDSGPF